MTAYGGRGVTVAVRFLIPLTIISIAFTAVAVIFVLTDGGDLSEGEGQAIAIPVVMAVIGIATSCCLATAGTRYWPVGVLGGLVLGWSAAYTLLQIWDQDFRAAESDTMARLHAVGLILTVVLAQIALLLGVAGDRPRLRVVLWPTLAVAVAATGLATSLALTEEAATEGELLTLGVLSIAAVLGTLATLALALFGSRSPTRGILRQRPPTPCTPSEEEPGHPSDVRKSSSTSGP